MKNWKKLLWDGHSMLALIQVLYTFFWRHGTRLMMPAGSEDLRGAKLWIIVCLFLKVSVQAICRKGL